MTVAACWNHPKREWLLSFYQPRLLAAIETRTTGARRRSEGPLVGGTGREFPFLLYELSKMGHTPKEANSRALDCGFVDPRADPLRDSAGVCTGDFHITNPTCKTLASDGGFVGAFESDTACVGYRCGGSGAPSTPPVDVSALKRSDTKQP